MFDRNTDARTALLLGTLFEKSAANGYGTSALASPDYSFDAYGGEIPDVDEGFDGLALFYGGDLLEKTAAVEPSRLIPAIKSPADYLSLPWAASELEVDYHGTEG